MDGKIVWTQKKDYRIFWSYGIWKNPLKDKSTDTISSLKNHYLKYIQECDKDIFDYGLFEKDIKKEKVNGKYEYEYKLNICKYIKISMKDIQVLLMLFFNLFFPNFLREIWKC